MKIQHRVPPNWSPPSARLDEDYAAEVRRSTERGERLYRRARKRLEQAESRLERAKTRKASRNNNNRKRQIQELEALVELRRSELEHYRRLMESSPASAEHRGQRSYRPMPPTHGSKL